MDLLLRRAPPEVLMAFSTVHKFETVLLEANESGVAKLTLNRPDRLNALTPQLAQEFRKCLDTFENRNELKVLIVTGKGRGFCSGADLRRMEGDDQSTEIGDVGAALRSNFNPLITEVNASNKVIIGSINGVCAGAGFSLALACDLRVASTESSFISAFIRIGLVPDCGISYFLPRLVGQARANEIMLTGNMIDAKTAFDWGMLNQLVEPDELDQKTLELAAQIARRPSTALGWTKRIASHSSDRTLAELLEEEAYFQSRAAKTPEFHKQVAAFVKAAQSRKSKL